MLNGLVEGLVLAIVAALILGGVTWLWRRARPWARAKAAVRRTWLRLHGDQLAEIQQLRQDVDALLNVLDHWVTPGAGDKQRQFEYVAEVLAARGRRGCSGASMRVAQLIDGDLEH
jgi:hypothetical protein